MSRGFNRQGEKNHKSKLKIGDINTIRWLDEIGIKQRIIGQHYGLSKPAVNHVCSGQNWEHIPRNKFGVLV